MSTEKISPPTSFTIVPGGDDLPELEAAHFIKPVVQDLFGKFRALGEEKYKALSAEERERLNLETITEHYGPFGVILYDPEGRPVGQVPPSLTPITQAHDLAKFFVYLNFSAALPLLGPIHSAQITTAQGFRAGERYTRDERGESILEA